MTDFGAPELPLSAQLPASIAVFLLLLFALRMAGSTSGRFVVFACWLRFMLSSYHLYTFRKVIGPMSGTALGSASLFVLGLVLLPRTLLTGRHLWPAYPVFLAVTLSAVANSSLLSAFEPITKLGLFVVLALHCFNALRAGEEKRFVFALLLSFAPLFVFQAISIALHLPKATEGTGADAYIGGYYHEAAFSIALIALLALVVIAEAIPRGLKLLIIPVGLGSIVLANYRTAILATGPLIIYYLLYAISRPVDRRLRGMIVAVAGAGLIVAGGISLMTLDRFKDLQTVVQSGTALIKPPDEFSTQDRRLLSGRTQIWSEYIYKWRDGTQLQHLVGYGPESWEDYFDLYAHNTFIDYLFEYGLIGVAALSVLFLSGLLLTLRTRRHRWKLISAHLSFITLNLATMPLWLIEGNIVYALLWGYTLFYSAERSYTVVRRIDAPVLTPVST